MNGYGPFLQPLIWLRIYWAVAAILLAIITNLLWVRGTESSWRVRLNLAAARFSRASLAGALGCLVLMAGIGGYIFYNTHVLNPYRTTFKIDEARAQYEKKYKQYCRHAAAACNRRQRAGGLLSGPARALDARNDVAGKQDVLEYRSRGHHDLAG